MAQCNYKKSLGGERIDGIDKREEIQSCIKEGGKGGEAYGMEEVYIL